MTVTPLQAALNVLDRAENLLSLDTSTTPEPLRQDLRRQAWAMGSAAIDTYFHWLVRKVDLRSGTLAKALNKLEVPFGDLVEIARDGVDARRNGIAHRPVNKARNVLYDRVLQDTYQTQRGVETAMSLSGFSGYWALLATEMGEPIQEIQSRLNSLAHRRNKIVHEGDIQRQSKPRAVKHNTVEEAEIRMQLEWVRIFINAVGKITS